MRIRDIVYVSDGEPDPLRRKIGQRLLQGTFDVIFEAQVEAMNIMSPAFQG
jgi:hypothetical protein